MEYPLPAAVLQNESGGLGMDPTTMSYEFINHLRHSKGKHDGDDTDL
jgi:hypothetical protein